MDDPAPTNLVALRDRREQVIAILTDHFAGDVLDVDEFDARVDAAHRATTIVALDRLVSDLTVTTTPASTAITVRDDPSRTEFKSMTAILGGLDRRGPWLVPRKLRTRVWLGGGHLDFRDADFGPGVTELHVSCVMGGLEIIVPPQLAVDIEVSSIMGGVDERHATLTADPGRAVLRITGLVVMGGIDIQTRLPGETKRQARRRDRRQRRARQHELSLPTARALPPAVKPRADE